MQMYKLSRRKWVAGLLGTAVVSAASRPEGTLVDAHVELTASDTTRFPHHADAPGPAPAADLRLYRAFIDRRTVDRAVLVQPEIYQDDHRYFEHCLKNEPSPGFFKGICLLDPIRPDAPERLEAMLAQNPNRIVGLRIVATDPPGTPPSSSGAIRNRDFHHGGMKAVWHKIHELGLIVQMDFHPHCAGRVYALAVYFQAVPVVLNFFGRPGAWNVAETEALLKLAQLPSTYLQISGLEYLAGRQPPLDEAVSFLKRSHYAFGPDRILWGGLGCSTPEFERALDLLETFLKDLPPTSHAKIRGLTAMKLFGFSASS